MSAPILVQWIGLGPVSAPEPPRYEHALFGHPRRLPLNHPAKVAWRRKISASKSGRPIRQRQPTLDERLCRCCPDWFAPTSARQLDCHACRSLIPIELRRFATRRPYSVAHATRRRRPLL